MISGSGAHELLPVGSDLRGGSAPDALRTLKK